MFIFMTTFYAELLHLLQKRLAYTLDVKKNAPGLKHFLNEWILITYERWMALGYRAIFQVEQFLSSSKSVPKRIYMMSSTTERSNSDYIVELEDYS